MFLDHGWFKGIKLMIRALLMVKKMHILNDRSIIVIANCLVVPIDLNILTKDYKKTTCQNLQSKNAY